MSFLAATGSTTLRASARRCPRLPLPWDPPASPGVPLHPRRQLAAQAHQRYLRGWGSPALRPARGQGLIQDLSQAEDEGCGRSSWGCRRACCPRQASPAAAAGSAVALAPVAVVAVVAVAAAVANPVVVFAV